MNHHDLKNLAKYFQMRDTAAVDAAFTIAPRIIGLLHQAAISATHDVTSTSEQLKVIEKLSHNSALTPICNAILWYACYNHQQKNIPERKSKKNGRVYFIQRADGLIKIGCANNIEARINQIKTIVGQELTLLLTIEGGKWLMGWPTGWTSLEPLDHSVFEAWQQNIATHWHAEPADVSRVVSGMTFRGYRLKAIGNGQVSRAAATAWTILGDNNARI